MKHGLRPHLIWTLLAIASIASLWYAWTIPGAIGLFVCIGAALALWYKLGSRGSWIALIVLGFGMTAILGTEAVTGSRCPPDDRKVFLEADEPPVGCNEMRASAGSMAVLFGLMGIIGVAAPLYARNMPEDDGSDDGVDLVEIERIGG